LEIFNNMSDCWINIRIGIWHIQAKYGSLWKWQIGKNPYWYRKWIKQPIAFYDIDLKGGWKRRKDGIYPDSIRIDLP